MKLARIEYQGDIHEAVLGCSGYTLQDGTSISGEEIRLLPPVAPGKILGVGWNFPAHIKEMADRTAAGDNVTEAPAEEVPSPILFFKPFRVTRFVNERFITRRERVRQFSKFKCQNHSPKSYGIPAAL